MLFRSNDQDDMMQDVQEVVEHEDDHKTLPPIQTNNKSHNFRKSSLHVMHPGQTIEISEFSNISAVPNVLAGTTDPSTPTGTTNTDRSSISSTSKENSNSNSNSNSNDGGCTGNPGTCKQCQMDPMSTLFCTTVASRTSITSETVTQ